MGFWTEARSKETLVAGVAILAMMLLVFDQDRFLRLAGLLGFCVLIAVVLLALTVPERPFQFGLAGLVLVAIFCFALMCLFDFRLGGTAINGKCELDKYFLGSHGHYTEVSRATFRRLLIPEILVFALWPVVFCLPAILKLSEWREERHDRKA